MDKKIEHKDSELVAAFLTIKDILRFCGVLLVISLFAFRIFSTDIAVYGLLILSFLFIVNFLYFKIHGEE